MSNKPIAGTTQVGERFESPRPTFQPSSNPELLTPKEKDNSPAKSVVQQVKETGNDKLADLIAKATANAKVAAERAAAIREGRKAPAVKRESKKKEHKPIIIQPGPFTPEDVCDDTTFLRKTVRGDYHTPEMKALFWANGGAEYLSGGLSYAAAFTNMRNDKLKTIRKPK